MKKLTNNAILATGVLAFCSCAEILNDEGVMTGLAQLTGAAIALEGGASPEAVSSALSSTLSQASTASLLSKAVSPTSNTITPSSTPSLGTGIGISSSTGSGTATLNSPSSFRGNLIDAEGLRNTSDQGQQYKTYADLLYQQYKESGNEDLYELHRQTVISFKSIL